MDPRDFHALAARLSSSASAADLRTAVSRSYYAVFNVGASHLRDAGFAIGKGAAAHGEVQKCLNNCGDQGVMAVATELNDLHGARNRADNQLDRRDPENRSNVLGIVAQAGDHIRVLDLAFQGIDRAKLQLTIMNWRRDNGYP
jgi:hypothetical protein